MESLLNAHALFAECLRLYENPSVLPLSDSVVLAATIIRISAFVDWCSATELTGLNTRIVGAALAAW